ncbi:fimbrial protein [Lelliottia wanjuensis]|uniref:fimbrial protein n=1 Tax=Lelliottia wanjuensis TaxID=3050585 RepID=UPI002550CD93|nr:fimbrial protein [Lelliottia sp. V104_15]MDK9606996.1 fimbrial protein [Lelliottia sp. V104_15]
MRKLNTAVLGSLLFIYSILSWAGDMDIININGRITAAPCKVDTDSLNVAVSLGDNIMIGDLSKAESSTPWVAFHLKVVECPAAITKSTVTFSGKADTDNPENMYANDGTAKNVAVELQGVDGEPLGNGKSLTGAIDVDRTYTFNLLARAYSATGKATAGKISAYVTATFTYQ